MISSSRKQWNYSNDLMTLFSDVCHALVILHTIENGTGSPFFMSGTASSSSLDDEWNDVGKITNWFARIWNPPSFASLIPPLRKSNTCSPLSITLSVLAHSFRAVFAVTFSMVKGVFFLVTNCLLYLNTLTLPPSRRRDIKEHAKAFGDDNRAANIVSIDRSTSLHARACFFLHQNTKQENLLLGKNWMKVLSIFLLCVWTTLYYFIDCLFSKKCFEKHRVQLILCPDFFFLY